MGGAKSLLLVFQLDGHDVPERGALRKILGSLKGSHKSTQETRCLSLQPVLVTTKSKITPGF